MFELTISKQQLLPSLLTVASALDKKQSMAILSNILLKLTSNRLFLTATDLEIEITSQVECQSSVDNFVITVPAKKMIDIIRLLDDDAMPRISFTDGLVTIKQGRSLFKLATLSADNYPNMEGDVADVELYLNRLDLMRLLQSTQFAIAQHDVRVFLNGMLLELDAQAISAVAMDGHRMAIARFPNQANYPLQRLLLPRKGVLELLRLLTSVSDEKILLSAGKRQVKLTTQQFTFTTKLIEARFPAYARAMPRDHDKHVVIESEILKRALSRIMILANEKSRAVLLHIQSGLLTLIANNQESEEAMETLTAETEGDELKIGINAGYLLDVISHINQGLLRLSFSNMDSSILVESLLDENYLYIIMPMKI